MLDLFLSVVQSGDWKIATVVGIAALVVLIKRYVGKLAFLSFFATVRGNAVMSILVAGASAALSAVGAGAPITVTLLMVGLTAANFDQLVTGEKPE